MTARFFYIEVECGSRSKLSVRGCVVKSTQSVFGVSGVPEVDVLSCEEGRAVLRVGAGAVRRVQAALALEGDLTVLRATPTLQALLMSSPSTISYEEGQHVVIVASREELSSPSRVTLPEPEPTPGLIMPDGSINWGCPCLGGMATGPCGTQFRDAFSCFHYSEAEPKGSDCYEKFSVMQQCMSEYPELYGKDDEELSAALDEAVSASEASQPDSAKTDTILPDSAKPNSSPPVSGAKGDAV